MVEKAFLRGIVPAVPFSGHGLPHVSVFQNIYIAVTRIMASLTAVERHFCFQPRSLVFDEDAHSFQDKIRFQGRDGGISIKIKI